MQCWIFPYLKRSLNKIGYWYMIFWNLFVYKILLNFFGGLSMKNVWHASKNKTNKKNPTTNETIRNENSIWVLLQDLYGGGFSPEIDILCITLPLCVLKSFDIFWPIVNTLTQSYVILTIALKHAGNHLLESHSLLPTKICNQKKKNLKTNFVFLF